MYKVYSVLICLLFSSSVFATDICSEAGFQFQKAVDIYKKEGGKAFIKRILKNGPLVNDERSLKQADALGNIEKFFGTFESAFILSKKPLGTKSCYLIGVYNIRMARHLP